MSGRRYRVVKTLGWIEGASPPLCPAQPGEPQPSAAAIKATKAADRAA